MRIRDPGWKNTSPGLKKFESGINIPDPQPCWLLWFFGKGYCIFFYELQKYFLQSAVCEQLCNKSCKTRNALRVHRVRHHKPRDNKESSLLPPFLLGLWMTTEKKRILWTAPFFAYLLNFLALKETITWKCFFSIPSHTEYKIRISKKFDFGRTLAAFSVLEDCTKIFFQQFMWTL